jgi:hypothetical protein
VDLTLAFFIAVLILIIAIGRAVGVRIDLDEQSETDCVPVFRFPSCADECTICVLGGVLRLSSYF